MKKFILRRMLPAMLALSIVSSVMVVPVRAVDAATVLETIQNVLGAVDAFSSFANQLDEFLHGTYASAYGYCWRSSESPERSVEYLSSMAELEEICAYINQKGYTESGYSENMPGVSALKMRYPYLENAWCISLSVAGATNRLVFLASPESGAVYVYDENHNPGGALTPDEEKQYTSARWIPAQQVQLRSGFTVPVPLAKLKELAAENGGTVYKSSITDDGGTADFYYIIKNGGRYILGDSAMKPYTYVGNRVANKPEDRPTGSIWVVDENGDLVQVETDDLPDNVGVDLGTLIGNLPTDSNVIFNGCTYDESTKTYYYHTEVPITIDNRQYYYFTYNYHINYTSVTYIGTTEEYDKHYEVYYQLPDGRSSADLTAEELERLNLSIDVINYGRSADDVSLRSLYHFDGDTRDASYWNYCTEFSWNKGASLTYMDEGTFNGSLYLDETEHDFTFTMPSGLTGDFTLQFRYYQSATAAPQTDSYINLGSTAALKLDGANIKNGSGTTLSAMPIGSWNELALIRDSGALYYYLNGVKIGSATSATVFDKITFHFGSSQQTFKKLDELRILNYALQKGGASYTPTSVPHDTNLALVLPDTAKPIADEYWNVTFGNSDSDYKLDFSKGDTFSGLSYNNCSLNYLSNGVVLRPDSSCTQEDYEAALGGSLSYTRLSRLPSFSFPLSPNASGISASGQASFLLSDGTIVDFRFEGDIGDGSASGAYWDGSSWVDMYGGDRQHDIFQFNGGFICLNGGLIAVVFDPSSDLSLVAAEFRKCWSQWNPSVSAVNEARAALTTRSTMTAEHITSITAMTPEDLATPTLAVRSDIPVTSWQIGGVRPSVPSKGQVWALVERQYITSLQIYNGRAWEACDGRVWTGSRWVPYSAYNVITLKDMSDIVDGSSPDKEYIYTESGFWDWLQRFLTGFKKELFARLDKLKGSGGAASSSAVPDVPSGSGSYDFSDGSEDVTIPKAAKDSAGGLWAFIKGAWKLVGGAFKNAGKAVSDLTDAGDTTNPNGAFGFFLIPLEEEGG